MRDLLNAGLNSMIGLIKIISFFFFHATGTPMAESHTVKNNLTLLILAIALLPAIFSDSSKAHAYDITAGATTWYAWGKQYNYQKDKKARFNSLVESDPSFLYGPAISVKYDDDFNLTFVFLYGRFESEKSEFKRIDSDLALNYKLNDYLKVFAGLKFLSYGVMPTKLNFFGETNFIIDDIDTHTSYGTGLGLSATVPIIENLFGLATLSGLYLLGNQKFDIEKAIITGPPPGMHIEYRSIKIWYHEYGVNTNASIAYYISNWSTVVSLGGRLQYIIADYKSNDIYVSSIRFLIYGMTLTATYTFDL